MFKFLFLTCSKRLPIIWLSNLLNGYHRNALCSQLYIFTFLLFIQTCAILLTELGMTMHFKSIIKLKRPWTSMADGLWFYTIVSCSSVSVISCRYLCLNACTFIEVFYFNYHFLKEQGKLLGGLIYRSILHILELSRCLCYNVLCFKWS